ncbi:putative 2-dehydropantoate 2-reductase-like protein [Phaeoacremonium minimum UCRPA7]|uniref:Putative 2-dehydropantoate 2-reductase-like protein n=1 Tax=Phaeoacremonium minimum (strain UCR-PA7) TaxID=1286976 RepID=R8BI40_PHAM7|nr:putative 2-dehydropantoate 2-reductase-like protein [Phaeoacremonium minimum UCRPA7]EON98976.1 putative 2-dehydropantoate 2-reductase-like protein [Phaeoacremonium minimum UCRPA7]
MADSELMNVCSVGGNPVSAFLSWRLQATNACDVTLVWKSGYEHVAQYGISFKSQEFGNERFKPRHVVKTPEEAASRKEGAFDYVILCIKALPDVYDLASVIDSVVTPQHTCILINTTHTLGVESAIEERFPTNVVLSLVSGAELSQLGQSEFEHKGSTELWVGPANKNANIPASIQDDMAQALAMTLGTGQVDCKVSPNIRQHQYERVIGPIAFHPLSVIFETPNLAELMTKVGVSQLVSDVIDELLALAGAQGCDFPADFKKKTIDDMAKQSNADSIMWQDYIARRPMEVETEQEMRMRRGPPPPGPRRGPPVSMRNGGGNGGGIGVYDEDDEDDDYFDPAAAPSGPPIDPDNFDMMSVTSRKNRKVPSHAQIRKNPEFDANPQRNSRFRPNFGRNRSSQIANQVPGLHDNIMDDPLMGFTSNRYGNVDRGAMHQESRTNSLTAARLDELQYAPGGGPPMGMNGMNGMVLRFEEAAADRRHRMVMAGLG